MKQAISSSEHFPDGVGASRKKERINVRVIAVSTVGNALEWFDFTVFSFFAAIIAPQFFPSDNPTASMLAAWTTFGVGFLTRPLGGLLLGGYADRHGRKAGLLLTISIMAAGVLIIACAPTYAQIGIFAPILMLVGRCLQGFSAGGEIGGATAYLVEHAPADRRGLYGCFQIISQGLSMLLGALTGVMLTRVLTPEQLADFGWRIPFFLGLLIVPVGIYVRSQLKESPIYEQMAAGREKRPSILRSLVHNWRAVRTGFGLTVYGTISVYIYFYFMPSYATKTLNIPFSSSVIASCCAAVVYIASIFLAGRASDHIGRKKPMLASAALSLLIAYPLFALLQAYPGVGTLIFVQCCLMASLGLFQGAYCAFVCELFPAQVRATGLSVGYNFAVMIFGGFAGAIATLLVDLTQDKLAVVYYGMFGCVVGLMTMVPLKDRAGKPLL